MCLFFFCCFFTILTLLTADRMTTGDKLQATSCWFIFFSLTNRTYRFNQALMLILFYFSYFFYPFPLH